MPTWLTISGGPVDHSGAKTQIIIIIIESRAVLIMYKE